MEMKKNLEGEPVTISLIEVPEAPGPYAMSFGFDLMAMAKSIDRVGVLNRPVVERDNQGRLHVVAGYRRLMALKALQRGEALCTDLTGAHLPFLQKLLIAFYDNRASRDFNDVEKGMVLERFVQCVPRGEVISFYMPLLALRAHESVLETYLQIQRLDTETKLALTRKQISLHTVRLLLDMDEDSRNVLSEWLLKIRFNINCQREFIEYACDISHRDGLSVRQVLSDKNLLALLSDERQNQPQRIKAVLDALRHSRFPALSRAEKIFRNRIHALKLPPDVRIGHPPGFESSGYRLEVQFSDGEVLQKRLLEIVGLKGLETLGDPWKAPE